MKRYFAISVVAGAICLSPVCAWSAIVDINLEFGIGYHDPAISQYMWSFDYDLQHLTIIEEFFDPDYVWNAWLDVEGLSDSETSTFSATKIVTNSTGLPWSDYWFRYGHHSRVWVNDVWMEMTGFTEWQTVVEISEFYFHFSDPGGLPEGETFTLQFDVRVDPLPVHGGLFHDQSWQSYTAVPEPLIITLLGLGGLALLKRQNPIHGKGPARRG